jgi:predicted transcriptional regulator
MGSASQRVNIVLDEERAVKLRRVAERTHTTPGTLARSLLSTALDEADPDPRTIVDLLDRIPGAWEDITAGLAEAEAGQGIRSRISRGVASVTANHR